MGAFRLAVTCTVLVAGCRLHFDYVETTDAGLPASCVGLPETCGPAADRSCCETIVVPGGNFFRSYDVAVDGLYADMSNPATVSAFRLDRFEVTVGRFRPFVDASLGTRALPPGNGAGAHPHIPGSGWSSTWDVQLPIDSAALVASFTCSNFPSYPGTAETMPMNCVSWHVAAAFCIWDGGYLPTEAEWNLAASGGDEQRAYAWSSPPSDTTIDCSYADFQGCAPGGPSPVGSRSPKGDARWGHADLAGNVWEWVLDFDGTLPLPCDDCLNTIADPDHVVRGGSIASTSMNLRAADRYWGQARGDHIGLRCARPL